VVVSGPQVGDLFVLDAKRAVIGRGSGCSIVIDTSGVSEEHASVEILANQATVLSDLDSTNGTFVNGNPIDKEFLRDGDKVLIGKETILKFTYQDKLDRKFLERMVEDGVRDSLTNLYNRRYFDQQLETSLSAARRNNVPLTLVIFDVDHFKKVNDTYGHSAGDVVLQSISNMAVTMTRQEDIVTRFGGEEFAIISLGIDNTGAERMAELLRLRIANTPVTVSDQDDTRIEVQASFGATTIPPGRDGTAAELIKEADANLYKAKNTGRNRTVTSEFGAEPPAPILI
jgi:diguanylate cyclase (GGDEF)-like protein